MKSTVRIIDIPIIEILRKVFRKNISMFFSAILAISNYCQKTEKKIEIGEKEKTEPLQIRFL
jgi:hypothetical protein